MSDTILSFDNMLVTPIAVIDPNMPMLPSRAFLGVLGTPTLRGGYKKKDGKPWVMMDCLVTLDDEEAKTILNTDTPSILYSLMLDCNEVDGQFILDTSPGKNQRLSILLEQFHLNNGKSTLMDLEGKTCLVTPIQEEGQDGIKRNRVSKIEAYN